MYHRGIYREHGGDKMVVQSTSAGATNAGEIEVRTGGHLDMQAGSWLNFPVQSLGSSQVATTVTNFGISVLTGTTTGPTYTMAAPVIGVPKFLALSASSSGVTHRAVVKSNSTGVSFDSSGGNQITFATSATRGVTLVAETTAKWRILGVYSGVSIAAPRTT